MNTSYDISFTSHENTPIHNFTRRGGLNISNELADIDERLRVSALTKAAKISPLVQDVTIGPNSPRKRVEYKDMTPIIEKEPDENLFEDKLREDQRYSLIVKKCENEIQERFDELFKNILGNMLCKHTEANAQFYQIQAKECNKRTLPYKEQIMQVYKIMQENDNLSLEKTCTDERNCPIVNTQTAEKENKNLEEQEKASARFASITESHANLSNLLSSEPLFYRNATHSEHDVEQAKILALNIENIKKSTVPDSEIEKQAELLVQQKQAELLVQQKQAELLVQQKQAELLVQQKQAELLKQQKQEELLEQQKQEELLKQQKQEELLKKQLLEEQKAQDLKQAQAAAAEIAKTQQIKKTKPIFYSNSNYRYYEELRNYLDQYEAQYKDLLQNTNLKKFRFDCQKAVNTPVNALSSVSTVHMRDKYDKLTKLLKGEPVQVLDITVQATKHPQGLAYCTALLAKKIVRQGDLLVSSNTEAAYPLAAVTVALWAQFPHFGKLLEANFHRFCPYLVPMYLPQKEGQTDKDFYLSRGYTYNDEGIVEKQDKFLKRMSGIFSLRCAIWVAKMPRFLNVPHPNGMNHAWKWLASFVNLKPEPDISATLLHDFFILCGSRCSELYTTQFRKILVLTSSQYLKILEDIDEGGPKTRLEVYLQTAVKSNGIPPPPKVAQEINW